MKKLATKRPAKSFGPATARVHDKRDFVVVFALVVVSLVGWSLYSRLHASAHTARPPSVAAFEPTVPNTAAAPIAAPQGMVWIPGGEFSMGAQDPPGLNEIGMQSASDARPIHRVAGRPSKLSSYRCTGPKRPTMIRLVSSGSRSRTASTVATLPLIFLSALGPLLAGFSVAIQALQLTRLRGAASLPCSLR